MKIELGKKYKDSVHGIEGIATVFSKFMTGCDRVCLEYVKDGSVKDLWVDVTRLEGFKPEPQDIKPGGPGKVAPQKNG